VQVIDQVLAPAARGTGHLSSITTSAMSCFLNEADNLAVKQVQHHRRIEPALIGSQIRNAGTQH
jgi:hypothetical protein